MYTIIVTIKYLPTNNYYLFISVNRGSAILDLEKKVRDLRVIVNTVAS